MFELSINNIVTVSRGDSFECPLFLNQGTDVSPIRYEIQDDEYVIFAIERPNQPFECAVFKKTFTKDNLNAHGDVVVKIESKDTLNLCPGNYFYEIKAYLYKRDKRGRKLSELGVVNTVVEKTKFIIL